MADEQDLLDLTVSELRARLRNRSLPTAGKKSELIKRLSVLVQSQTLPVVADEPMDERDAADGEEVSIIKERKSTKKKTKKSKASHEPLEEVSEVVEQLEEVKEEEEEAADEVPIEKKARKSTVKKAQKSKKSQTPMEAVVEVVDLEAEMKQEEGAEVDEDPVDKKARKSTIKKVMKAKKSQTPLEEVYEEEVVQVPEVNDEGEERAEEAPTAKKSRKSTKKKTSTSKKDKKHEKSKEVMEEREEEEEKEDDEHNTSTATYAIVSPSEVSPSKELVDKKATPARRPSECRRSIFKKLGLDPSSFTPSSGSRKREATPRQSSVKRRKTEVLEVQEDTVEEKEEGATVPDHGDTVDEEQKPIDETEKDSAPDEVETIEDEEMAEEAYGDAGEAIADEPEEEEEEMREDANEHQDQTINLSDVLSEDGVNVEMNESILSEASAKSVNKSRRSSIGVKRLSSAKKAPDSAKLAPASASRSDAAGKPPRSAKPAPATAERAQQGGGAKTALSSRGRMAPGERFKAQHEKLFAQQEFIGDTIAKREERKAALLNTSASTNRLATPKTAGEMRKPLRQQEAFKFGSSVVPKTFQFGSTAVEDIQTVQKRPSQIPGPSSVRNNLSNKKKGDEDKKLDAKARSKIAVKQPVNKNPLPLPTIPDDSSFVDRMATPKAQLSSASRAHRGANGYTPHRGKVTGFVDTSKLSDREYQIAMEAGLIGGKKKTVLKSDQKAENEMRRNHARDELINVKRKLNLA